MVLFFIIASFCAAAALTRLVLRYARAHELLDVPNERSSHAVPTPRGGGLAMVAALLPAVALLALLGKLETAFAWALILGGALVATLGWRDDRRSMGVLPRIAVHVLIASVALSLLGGMPELRLGQTTVALGGFGMLLGILGIVWMSNLFNFMDGIDGLAASEAVFVGFVGGALLLGSRASELAVVAFLLAAVSGGFLLSNWQPARIFMGDVGSLFLGFCFAVLAVESERRGFVPILVWAILLAVFVTDATLTTFRRMIVGQRWYEAHRGFAYQRAVQRGSSHGGVVFGAAAINGFLGSAAWFAVAHPSSLPIVLVVTYAGAAVLWFYFQRVPVASMPDRVAASGHR